jgi:MSHA biogenesis protein MshJ
MKAMLKRYAERVDNATLRERVLLFAAATLVLLFLANALLLKPLREAQRRYTAEIAQRQTELSTVQAELQRMARGREADPDARNRARLAALRAEETVLNAQLAEEQRRFTTPQRMREVLGEMLERNKRLQLVDLRTLPITDLSATQGQAGRRIFRHGVELTVVGSYLDLHAYLRALEELSTQLYWGKLEMNVTAYPSVSLKLTVYTVSFDKAWLVV